VATRAGEVNDAALSPAARARALDALAGGAELDVLVIGGGVVGAGAALDAVTRGLSTGLVEGRDWASGTSSRSSKLIHGGLRYLEMLDFGLVREALTERGLLRRLAPHLIRPVPFLYPLQHRFWERPYAGTGLMMYDTFSLSMGAHSDLPRHRHLTRRAALRVAPSLRPDALIGGIQYHDAQVDDSRHTMTVVRTAASYGAACANRARVVGFERQGEHVTGARVRDLESGHEFAVRAKQIVNATGVWTDDTQSMVGERGQFHVRASKGVHLVVPRDRIHASTGLILRTETSVLFVIPWGRHWLIGTTDTDWDLDKAHPAASARDIDYLLERVNEVLVTPLVRQDVEGVYAGLRPLLAGESEATSRLSREHAVAHPAPGLVVVAGGKYTTYRVMAKDAIDAAVHGLGFGGACVTDQVPLVGGVGYAALWNQRAAIARRHGVHVARVEHLLQRYGSLTHEVLALIDAQPSLGAPLPGADDYMQVEVAYAVSHEGARHLDDVLTRRTHISIETFHRGVDSAPTTARLMAPLLGWSEDHVAREVEHYRARVEAERLSQEQPDDDTADAARLGAADTVPVG
jgi:glycerol-3-phosphate dehydrogenase